VAVLDRASRFLIGSLSVSDIRHVDSPQKLDALSQPVGEFLRDRRGVSPRRLHHSPQPSRCFQIITPQEIETWEV
jgi:hypothetical protein